jgi:SAM-dependent methyltransferase
MTHRAEKKTTYPNSSTTDRARLVTRINEIYHDCQAEFFNELHHGRHRIEREFWAGDVAGILTQAQMTFGVDLCSGTGFVPRVLRESISTALEIVCIDLSGEALRQCRTSLPADKHRITGVIADASVIPLAAGRADWVSLNAGLHHLPNPGNVLKEIDRVLKPGGYFCLGHEPNAAFFRSRWLSRQERLIWNLFWYGSLRRNLKRIQRKFGFKVDEYAQHEHLDTINTQLLSEGLIDNPLSLGELRDLVDLPFHEEDDDHAGHVGFAAPALIERYLPRYQPELIRYSDYGGEMLLGHPWLRRTWDAVMRVLAPGKGRLFSWILRKPTS